jgi:hypothetical protein
MTFTEFAIVCIACLVCFGAGMFFKQRVVNTANEAKLDAQKAFTEAKNEWKKLKAGAKHRLDEIFG